MNRQENNPVMTMQMPEKAVWKNCIGLTFNILNLFSLQWILLNISTPVSRIFLSGVATLWLFFVTGLIIQLDERLKLPFRLTFFTGQLLSATTVSVWLGFIIVPVLGLVLRPRQELAPLVTIYLVMGLVNLLFKLNRRVAFRNWLKISAVPPGEVQAIHDVRMIRASGLYALVVRPWWIMQVEMRESGCVVDLLETEGQSLVEISPGKQRRKHSASMTFAVSWLERRLKRQEASRG